MKNIIISSLLVLATSSFAHTIQGTLILKGSIKTKIYVNNVKTTCKVKVEKVKNLMLEDSYGNPAYNVRINVNLSGRDHERDLSVKFDRELWVNNLFTSGNTTEVRDLEYASNDGLKMKIDGEGRIENVTFLYGSRLITCSFR